MAPPQSPHAARSPARRRGPEYLRIIYEPEYTAPEHVERLRSRGLGTKRGLAMREYAWTRPQRSRGCRHAGSLPSFVCDELETFEMCGDFELG